MVSVFIISIIGTVIITNQGEFNKSVKLQNITHEISLSIRDIQNKATNADSSTDSVVGLGVYFNSLKKNSDPSLDQNKEFYIFVNQPTNPTDQPTDYVFDGSYNEDQGDYIIDTVSLPSEFILDDIYACEADSTGTYSLVRRPPSSYSLTFARPNLNANFALKVPGGVDFQLDGKTMVIIVADAIETGSKRYIVINSSGLIYTVNELSAANC